MSKEETEEIKKRNSIISEQEKADAILDNQKNMSSDDKNAIRDIISGLANELIQPKKYKNK